MVRVASIYLGEDTDTTTLTADMSNGVLPTSGQKQKDTKGGFKMKLKKDYKRTQGKKKTKSKRYNKIKRKKTPVKKYRSLSRKTPKKVERKPSGGARSWSDYKKDYDWSADNQKRKDQKAEWEKKNRPPKKK